jgi:hypothetical protein
MVLEMLFCGFERKRLPTDDVPGKTKPPESRADDNTHERIIHFSATVG